MPPPPATPAAAAPVKSVIVQQPESLYDKSIDWLTTYGPRIIIALVIFFIGQWLIHMLHKRVQRRMDRHNVHSAIRPFLQSLLFIGLQVALLLSIIQIIGIHLTFITAVITAIGAAAALSLSGTLQNFASGILILLLKPFDVEDNIIAQGQEGTVTSIQIFYTVITTFDNRTVVIPNGKLSNEIIVNVTRKGRRRMDIELKFNYGTDLETIRKVLMDAITKSGASLPLPDPEPRIGVTALEPDGYKLLINVWVNAHGFEDTRLAVHEKLLDALKSSGIKLPGME